jgi:beta-lactamase regulating signal transducer with metallopeptidase domain
MNWQIVFAYSKTADWIALTVFHSLWISLAALLILHIRRLKIPAVRSTWCTYTLVVLLALPLITWVIPRTDLRTRSNSIPYTETKPANTGANSAPGHSPTTVRKPILYRLPGVIIPLPQERINHLKPQVNLFGILWIVVTLGFIGRLFYELAFLKGYCSNLEEVTDARISALLKEVKEVLGFRREARFFLSHKLTSPISIGVLTPSVIVPASLYPNIDDSELRAILLHELAHIYHYDHVLGLFQRIIKALYWWNPIAYRLCNTLSAAREEVSDNHAISGMKSASTYAALLVSLVEKTSLTNNLLCTAGMANPYVSLETRIKNLVSKERDMSIRANRGIKFMIGFAAILLCGLVAIGSRVEVFGIGQASSSDAAAGMIDGWFKAGSVRQDYVIGKDHAVYKTGSYSLYLASVPDRVEGFGTIMKNMQPGNYLNKRVRMSAYIKAENVADWAGMWMRIDGDQNNMLGFDNMQTRPIKGTTAWQQCEIVLDVPQEAKNIAFGVLMSGTGKVWLDNVAFDIVDPGQIKATGQGLTQLDGWNLAGDSPQNYEIGKDSNVRFTGTSSYFLFSKKDSSEGFGTIMKSMLPGDYRGRRVRMSAYIKSENIPGWAGMWMRIDGKSANKQSLGFDNMQNRPITGTTPWQKYEIVLDVPLEATDIAFGILMRGPGKIWFDKVTFDVVDSQVPTTGF